MKSFRPAWFACLRCSARWALSRPAVCFCARAPAPALALVGHGTDRAGGPERLWTIPFALNEARRQRLSRERRERSAHGRQRASRVRESTLAVKDGHVPAAPGLARDKDWQLGWTGEWPEDASNSAQAPPVQRRSSDAHADTQAQKTMPATANAKRKERRLTPIPAQLLALPPARQRSHAAAAHRLQDSLRTAAAAAAAADEQHLADMRAADEIYRRATASKAEFARRLQDYNVRSHHGHGHGHGHGSTRARACDLPPASAPPTPLRSCMKGSRVEEAMRIELRRAQERTFEWMQKGRDQPAAADPGSRKR
jgi:hypothetical protein